MLAAYTGVVQHTAAFKAGKLAMARGGHGQPAAALESPDSYLKITNAAADRFVKAASNLRGHARDVDGLRRG